MPAAPVSPMPTAPMSTAPVSPMPHGPSIEPFHTTVTASPLGNGGFNVGEHIIPVTVSRLAPEPAPGSRANWPLTGPLDDPLGDAAALRQPSGGFEPRPGRVTPPWQADDLPEPPKLLRLVDPPPLADPALRDDPLGDLADFGGDPLRFDLPARLEAPARHDPAARHDLPARREPAARHDLAARLEPPARHDLSARPDMPARFDPPALRVVDGDGLDRGRRPGGPPIAAVPPIDADPVGDADLLIFAEMQSAWFAGEPATDVGWGSADAGWAAAEQAARPSVGTATQAGLPRRVPQANLVPGSPIAAPERPLRIVRDPESIAAHTSGYFRGWRRGQEIGGYAVGGRPGRESAQGWDFNRDHSEPEYDYNSYDYRQAAYRS